MEISLGQLAPEFEGRTESGNIIKLKDFAGKKVILYFYPKDFTPDCTVEACNLRNNYQEFKTKGYEVIGVSSDNIESHKRFKDKYRLPFDLVSDENQNIQKLYGVAPSGSFMSETKRSTFVIDESGKILDIINAVDTRNHAEQIISGKGKTKSGTIRKLTDIIINRIELWSGKLG